MDDSSGIEPGAFRALLVDKGGVDVVVLEMGPDCSFASHMIVATATSRAHMGGMASAVKERADGLGIPVRGGWKQRGGDEWTLVDAGDLIIHLMTAEAREYYALEERWFEAKRLGF